MRINLKIAIVRRFGTSRALARRVGISEGRLSDIVCARYRPPSDRERRQLARALGEPADVLFAEEG